MIHNCKHNHWTPLNCDLHRTISCHTIKSCETQHGEGSMEMDFELERHDFKGEPDLQSRNKTALRMKYEAEARVFLQKYGGLENIRKNLGFSQRKISQLLLVDPSAWSRWVKDEKDGKIP